MARTNSSLNKGYTIFLIPGIIVFLTMIFLPLAANLVISFTRWQGVGPLVWTGLANYQKAMNDPNFWASFKNNLSLITWMTVIPTIIGLVLAAFLFDFISNKFGQGVASFFRAGFYLPQIIPVVVAAIVWKWIFQPDWGVLNWFLKSLGMQPHDWLGDSSTALLAIGIVMVWVQIGYPLVIFMAGLQRLDPELYEAASIDGAKWLERFCFITIPLLQPEIYVVVLTTIIATLKIFGPVFAMTKGGPGDATYVASYFSYKNFFETSNVGYGSTMSTVLTIIVVLITVGYIRLQLRQQARESLQ